MPPSIGSRIFHGISGLKVYVPHGTLEAYKNALGDNVNNAKIIEENQSTLYPQALELFTPVIPRLSLQTPMQSKWLQFKTRLITLPTTV